MLKKIVFRTLKILACGFYLLLGTILTLQGIGALDTDTKPIEFMMNGNYHYLLGGVLWFGIGVLFFVPEEKNG